jgi:hypothetical protein
LSLEIEAAKGLLMSVNENAAEVNKLLKAMPTTDEKKSRCDTTNDTLQERKKVRMEQDNLRAAYK